MDLFLSTSIDRHGNKLYGKSLRCGKKQLVKRFINQDALCEIFCRMPTKSVLACKLVCKTFLGISRSCGFYDRHLKLQLLQFNHFNDNHYYPCSRNNKAENKIGILLNVTDRDEEKVYEYLAYTEYHDDGERKNIAEPIKRINHPDMSRISRWIGSCDGLLCYSKHDGKSVYVCNLMLGEYFDFPRSYIKASKICYGFGATNTIHKEYKVVRILYYQNKQHEHVTRVEVYTLGSRGGWRNRGMIAHSFNEVRGVLADGALHWVDDEGKIWAFSLADETFRFLTQPPNINGNFDLVVLGGWLSYFQDATEKTTLWSFKKTTKEQQARQWCEVFSSGMPNDFISFALTNKGEVLYWIRKALRLYNPEAKARERLDIEDLRVTNSLFCGLQHVNSFVSLRTIGKKGERCDNRRKRRRM